jgi:hypothetical protein
MKQKEQNLLKLISENSLHYKKLLRRSKQKLEKETKLIEIKIAQAIETDFKRRVQDEKDQIQKENFNKKQIKMQKEGLVK